VNYWKNGPLELVLRLAEGAVLKGAKKAALAPGDFES
jgi:hypothetical protein